MRRLHLFELGDQAWLPRTWHQYGTDYLSYVQGLAPSQSAIFIPLIRRLLRHATEHRVIDLCSGGAGPWPVLLDQMAKEAAQEAAQRPGQASAAPVPVVMTDRSPNLPGFERARARSNGQLDFETEPVDATAVPGRLAGARTIFNGFHHFRPELARAVLADAARQRRPIGIFEILSRNWLNFLTVLLLPLAVVLVTPFIRPFRLGRLFWTYLVPVMPLYIFWDGLVSMFRVYSTAELAELVRDLEQPGYTWEIGTLQLGPVSLPYLLGLPDPPAT